MDEKRPVLPTTMVAWRILGMHNDYLSRRPPDLHDFVVSVSDSPEVDDETVVYIGEVPAYVVTAIREVRAALPVMAGMGGWHDSPDRLVARDKAVREQLQEVKTPEIYRSTRTWLTIAVRRRVELQDATGSYYLWPEYEQVSELSERFQALASPYFDVMTAYLTSALGDISLDEALSVSGRPYFLAEGKGAFSVPIVTAGPATVSIGQPWDSLPFGTIRTAVERAATVDHATADMVAPASQWLTAALNEKQDSLRAFFYSFFGLEVLVGKFVKKKQNTVVQQLKEELNGIPLHELMWPSSKNDDDYPVRNLVFQFAMTAIALSRETASEDVALFRRLARARNRIAHGGDVDLAQLPADSCRRLLHRYLALVAESSHS